MKFAFHGRYIGSYYISLDSPPPPHTQLFRPRCARVHYPFSSSVSCSSSSTSSYLSRRDDDKREKKRLDFCDADRSVLACNKVFFINSIQRCGEIGLDWIGLDSPIAGFSAILFVR